MSLIFVYITNPNKKEAKRIATFLLKKKLIGCTNIFNIDSIYSWKGKISEGKEVVLIAKTEGKNYSKIVKEIEKIHSYKIPCIIKIPVKANGKYDKWIKNNII
ncbi:MAG TPA: divalent-cation tolerance protein CutA [Candidatus Aenigmarchaeota archaeon]|nr:divalent-cation tolerance protein CutA [Candidatus Aenigmarchaeota archaeon]